MMTPTTTTVRRRSASAALLALVLLVGVSGCDSLLEVKNPNNIAGDDVLNPAAASAMANGALSGVARGFANILTSYATATDELEWSGSRDAYRELDFGNVADPYNEFTDDQFRFIAQGRWMADEAVRILTIHQDNGDLEEPIDLARAHMWRAIAYNIIADMYTDFAFSDRSVDGPPIGAANMVGLYDQAITSLGTTITLATSEGDDELLWAATAMRARSNFGKAIWAAARAQSGLVSSGAAVTDAGNAIAMASDADQRFEFEYSSATITASIGGWVNDRQEMRMGQTFTTPDPSAPTFLAVSLEDLIDVGTVSPELERIITDFDAASNHPTLTVVSNREMHLILAEHALATGDTPGFQTAINNLRALDGLTDWTAASGVTAQDMLIHSRATNLFLQGRRLSDLYRFDLNSLEWQPTSTAATSPTFFPIAVIECRANSNIPDTC